MSNASNHIKRQSASPAEPPISNLPCLFSLRAAMSTWQTDRDKLVQQKPLALGCLLRLVMNADWENINSK